MKIANLILKKEDSKKSLTLPTHRGTTKNKNNKKPQKKTQTPKKTPPKPKKNNPKTKKTTKRGGEERGRRSYCGC